MLAHGPVCACAQVGECPVGQGCSFSLHSTVRTGPDQSASAPFSNRLTLASFWMNIYLTIFQHPYLFIWQYQGLKQGLAHAGQVPHHGLYPSLLKASSWYPLRATSKAPCQA